MSQDSDKSLTVESRKSEFVPVTGGAETTSAEALLVAAYVLMWFAAFFFVWRTAGRQRTIETRLASLEKLLETKSDKPVR